MQKITQFLRFDDNAEEAVNFYVKRIELSSAVIRLHGARPGNWIQDTRCHPFRRE